MLNKTLSLFGSIGPCFTTRSEAEKEDDDDVEKQKVIPSHDVMTSVRYACVCVLTVESLLLATACVQFTERPANKVIVLNVIEYNGCYRYLATYTLYTVSTITTINPFAGANTRSQERNVLIFRFSVRRAERCVFFRGRTPMFLTSPIETLCIFSFIYYCFVLHFILWPKYQPKATIETKILRKTIDRDHDHCQN